MRRRPRESHGWRGLLHSGRVTGSREASGYPIPVRRLRLRPRNWVAVATAKNGQACAEWATRGDERRNTAAHGHGISLGVFRTALVIGVDETGSVSWRSRARRLLVGSAARRLDGPGRQLTGPVAEAPEVDLRRSARSDHETELAARPPGGADANSSFSTTQVSVKKVISPKKLDLDRREIRASCADSILR